MRREALRSARCCRTEMERLRSGIEFSGRSKGWTKDNEKFLGKYDMSEALLAATLEAVCTSHDHKSAAAV